MHLLVVGGVDDELQTHVLQRLRNLHTALKHYASARASVGRHGGFVLLCGCDVESWVHRVARELDITAILNVERLERNYRQRVFHLARSYGVASVERQTIVAGVEHSQIAAAHKVYIVRLVGVESAQSVCSVVDVYCEVHVESVDRRTLHTHSLRLAEVYKLHESVELVVGRQRRVAQYIRDVA